MTMMIAAARPCRRIGWMLAAAVTVIGLFAMHGLSAGHELFASGTAPTMAHLGSGGHTGHTGGGAMSEQRAGPGQAGARGPDCAACAMSGHAECVARLHSAGIDPSPHAVFGTSAVQGATAAIRPAANAIDGSRAPPPDLLALGVCRR